MIPYVEVTLQQFKQLLTSHPYIIIYGSYKYVATHTDYDEILTHKLALITL